jgi:hypothetical protein
MNNEEALQLGMPNWCFTWGGLIDFSCVKVCVQKPF